MNYGVEEEKYMRKKESFYRYFTTGKIKSSRFYRCVFREYRFLSEKGVEVIQNNEERYVNIFDEMEQLGIEYVDYKKL